MQVIPINSMKMQKLLAIFATLFFLSANAANAQIVVNEASQGSSSSKQYIELLVVGSPSCICNGVDLRKWIIDDNNGWLGAGNNQGINNGFIRFADSANWSLVRFGSIILLYDDANKNPSITLADDPTDANRDGVYVIPISSHFFESNISSPTAPSGSGYIYPATGFTAGGNWSLINLDSAGDAVVTVDPIKTNVAFFSLGYGNLNNSSSSTIYLPDAGQPMVYCLTDHDYTSS